MTRELRFSVDEEIGRFIDGSFVARPGERPEFVLLLGGVAAGKTTIRKQRYSKGYVVLDAGEIFLNLCQGANYEFGKDLDEVVDVIGYLIALQAMRERRNIVTEMTGGPCEEMIEAMLSVDYKIDVPYVHCDVETAMQRNSNRVGSDISAYYSGPYHARWIIRAAWEA
jgi:dephospho-CoA kinase